MTIFNSLRMGALALAATATFGVQAAPKLAANPVPTHPFAQSKVVPGSYIVVFKNSVRHVAAETANTMNGAGGQVQHVYSHAIKGFAATLPETALPAIRNNPNVSYIEADQTVALAQATSPESSATWGLDRIDQAKLPLDTFYQFNGTGAGVSAFIIDTGIRATHEEFAGRVEPGQNFVATRQGRTLIVDSADTNDCNGHGTHVAGTVGGTVYGVAKGVNLIPVRVLDCGGSGTWSGVIAGIDWVAKQTSRRPAVANMSLGGGYSQSVNAAVAGAVTSGVTMVVAAGNSNADACSSSPASEPTAITVGATDSIDSRAYYSNYGACVDIFAPGSGITSAWYTSNTDINTISGTSMASPHVAGVAALALQANAATSPSPAVVASILSGNATVNELSAIGAGSPNLLVYSLGTEIPPPAPKQAVAVQAMTGYGATEGRGKKLGWRAYATVTVGDPTDNFLAVANVTVTGTFVPGGSASCVTNSLGSCTVNSSQLSLSEPSTTMTVNSLTGTNITDVSSSYPVGPIPIYQP